MDSQLNKIAFALPDWARDFANSYKKTQCLNERMQFVIAASMKNIQQKTGGPFAAAIFEIGSGKLVSLGVNLVTTQGLSILHAEMVAIALAQKKLGSYDLGAKGMASHELITSTEPCAMCFGAIPWSGIRHVATAAQDKDARAIGFDEGPKPNNWVKEFEIRHIRVSTDIQRQAAKKVLESYSEKNGHIYNSREAESKI